MTPLPIFPPSIIEYARRWNGYNQTLFLTYADTFVLRSVGLFAETTDTLEDEDARRWLAQNGFRRSAAEMVSVCARVRQTTKDRLIDAATKSGQPAAVIIRRAIINELERIESECPTAESPIQNQRPATATATTNS